MFERTKLIMTGVFTICFLAYSVLVGHFYQRFNMSRNAWLAVCIVLSAVLAATFVMDVMASRRRDSETNKQ